MMRWRSLTFVCACVLVAACDNLEVRSVQVITDEIRADGASVATFGSARELQSFSVEVLSDNPRIDGSISFPEALSFTTDPVSRAPIACCQHPSLTSGVMVLNDSAQFDIGVREQEPRRPVDRYSYTWQAARVSLTPGARVTLHLRGNADIPDVFGSLTLSPDVILIPIHVVVFRDPARPEDEDVSRAAVTRWFDGEALQTLASRRRDGARIVTTVPARRALKAFAWVDPIWRAARIQFRLASFEVVDDAALAAQIVSGNARTFLPSDTHLDRGGPDVPGFHVYVGRNEGRVGPPSSGLAVFKGAAALRGCIEPNRTQNAVAVAIDQTRRALEPVESETALAHELGHELGLLHAQDSGPCGRDLVPDPTNNLMSVEEAGAAATLTPQQIEHARDLACQWLALWGVTSAACDSRE